MVDLTNNARFMAVMLTVTLVPTTDFLFRQISVGGRGACWKQLKLIRTWRPYTLSNAAQRRESRIHDVCTDLQPLSCASQQQRDLETSRFTPNNTSICIHRTRHFGEKCQPVT